MSNELVETQPVVGERAPPFTLSSIQGDSVSLQSLQDHRNIVLWFSRGFTCNFCRTYMKDISGGYRELQDNDIEVIQIAPNLHETARSYFDQDAPPHPFICDPDKRLYAVYGLGNRGVMEAARNTIICFSSAVARGKGVETVRAAALDMANRNFIHRLHHHALTAMEQGVFIIDRAGIIRYRVTVGSLDSIPGTEKLLSLTLALCQ